MRVLIFIFIFFITNLSFARVSERNFQAEKGQTFFQDGLTYETNSIDIDDAGIDPTAGVDFNDLRINLYLEHGFSDHISGYASLGYGFGEFEISSAFAGSDTTDVRGLDPINLGLKYQRQNSKGRFFGRTNLGYGLQESEEDSDGDVNRTSQVLTLNLKLGYEAFVGNSNIVGGSFSFTLISTDAKTEGEEDSETDGNVELSVYYEAHKESGTVLGAHLDYQQTGITSAFGYYGEDSDFSIIEIGGYTRLPLSERLFLLGGLDLGLSTSEPDMLDGLTRLRVSLGSRYLF